MNHTLMTAARSLLVASPGDPAEWDAFVGTAPGATFAHLYGWHDIIAQVMRQQPYYLAAWDEDGMIRGVLPLVRLKSLAFGVRYVSMPYLNDGGPIGSSAAVAALRDHAAGLSSVRGERVELRIRRQQPGAAQSPGKVTVLLDLPSEAEELWSSLPSKVRSQVRRPQKAGMEVRFGPAELKSFYAVWSRNMRDLGTPVLPKRFFEAVAETFPDRFVIGCVYRDNQPVAAGAGLVFGREFEITWASALREYSREAPNMLLYWEFMAEAIRRGAGTFNFGRCTAGEGTHRFKMQWGGETVALGWITYGAAAGSIQGPGRATRMASSMWQRLPLQVANAVGPTIARQLPWW